MAVSGFFSHDFSGLMKFGRKPNEKAVGGTKAPNSVMARILQLTLSEGQ